jgi:hypothetical protein
MKARFVLHVFDETLRLLVFSSIWFYYHPLNQCCLKVLFQDSLYLNQLSHIDSFAIRISYIGGTYLPDPLSSSCVIFGLCKEEIIEKPLIEIYNVEREGKQNPGGMPLR